MKDRIIKMQENNVKRRAAGGMIWTTIQRFAGIGIQFISGIILARLLMPEDYGCIGMLVIFMSVATVFMDGGLLIGRFYNAQTMGYYSKGRSVEGMATNSISEALKQVTFPLYSEFQNDLHALAEIIKKMTTSVSFVTYPIIFLMILIAKPVFLILYSEKWLESVYYFQVLCLAGLGTCLTGFNLQAIAAIGKSKLMFIWTIYKRIVTIIMIVVGMWLFGMEGLLWAVVLQSWMNYIVNAYLVSKHIGYNMGHQMLDMLPVFLISVAAFFYASVSISSSRSISIYKQL